MFTLSGDSDFAILLFTMEDHIELFIAQVRVLVVGHFERAELSVMTLDLVEFVPVACLYEEQFNHFVSQRIIRRNNQRIERRIAQEGQTRHEHVGLR